MENKVRWEDSPREDLKHIPYLQGRGYFAYLSPRDRQNNRTTPSNPPIHPVSFFKGNTILVLRINTVTETQEWVKSEVEVGKSIVQERNTDLKQMAL